MLSWAFALDHINYARWISVFIWDLKSLYGIEVYNEFCKGHFTVKKSNCAFSSIGEDHAHEQNNGGAIGILDHEEAVSGKFVLLNLTLLHGCFSRFLKCTNGTKSRKAPHLCFIR